MTPTMHGIGGKVVPLSPQSDGPRSPGRIKEKEKSSSFDQILEKQLSQSEDLRFSVHAQERIRLRNIQMDNQDIERLRDGVDRVAEKGGRESLVLLNDSAFLVSVRNRTIITAIGSENLKNNVFTNIDSTIIV